MSNLGQETNKINSIVSVLVAVSLSLLLTACGGGGGTAVAPEQPNTGNMDGNTGGDNGGGDTDSGDGSTAGGGGGGGTSPTSPGGGDTPDPVTPSDDPVEDAMTARDEAQEAVTEVPDILNRAAVETGANLIYLESNQVIAAAMGVSAGITAEAQSQVDAMKAGIAKVEEDLKTAKQIYSDLGAEAAGLAEEAEGLAGEASEANTVYATAVQALGQKEAVYNPLNMEIMELEQDALESDAHAADARLELAVLKDPQQSPDATNQDIMDKEIEIEAASEAAARYRMEAAEKRMAEAYIEAKQEFEAATRAEAEASEEAERLTTAENDKRSDQEAKEAEAVVVGGENGEGGLVEEITTSLENLKTALNKDITRWETALGDVSEQEKAEMVFALLAYDRPRANAQIRGSDSDPVINTTGDLMDLDTSAHVFLRAAPEGTMTFRQIAEDNNDWGLSRRTFRNPDNTINATKHAETGLPQNHYAINFQTRPKLSDFVVRAEGTFGEGGAPAGGISVLNQVSQYGFFHGQLNGMAGTLYCDRSGGCDLNENTITIINGEGENEVVKVKYLGDGFYFSPVVDSDRQGELGYNTEMSRYMDSDGDGVYELVDNYVDYGLWLEGIDDDVNSLTLQGRIGWVGTADVSVSNLNFGDSDRGLAGSATYSGDAHGLSARRTGAGDAMTTASGHFEADVTLNATFGTTPTLNGTIDNFRAVAGEGHVDPAWSIPLTTMDAFPTTVLDERTAGYIGANGVRGATYDGGKTVSGRWGWQAYGEMGNDQGQRFEQRPTGFFGDFEALFYNAGELDDPSVVGAAAGFYHAEKE